MRAFKEIKRCYTYPIEINNVNLEDELNYFLIGGILCTKKNDEIQHHHMYSLIEILHNIETLNNYNNIYYKDLQFQYLINLLTPIFNNYNKNNSTLEKLAIRLDLMGI